MITKVQLTNILGLKVVDYAIPLRFVEEARKLGIDTANFVWCYDEDSTFGKPVDLSPALDRIIGTARQCIEQLNYQQYKEAPPSIKDCIDQLYSILDGELGKEKPPRFDGPPMRVATYDDCITLVSAVRFAAAPGKSYCVNPVVNVVIANWDLLRPFDKALIRESLQRVLGDLEECYAKEWQKILDLPMPDASFSLGCNIDTAQKGKKEENGG